MTDVGPEALDWLTVQEVAERLRLSVKTIRRLIYAERKAPGTGLESVKVGNPDSKQAPVRVTPEAVVAYKKRMQDATQASAA